MKHLLLLSVKIMLQGILFLNKRVQKRVGRLTNLYSYRSLQDLNVLAETSIMSILRWNFKTNMEKTMSSFGNTNITMVRFFPLNI